jgi:hypothetical protein
MNIWASQMGLLKLLRSLEGGTRVQQIIIGYFVAPISYYYTFYITDAFIYLFM